MTPPCNIAKYLMYLQLRHSNFTDNKQQTLTTDGYELLEVNLHEYVLALIPFHAHPSHLNFALSNVMTPTQTH